MKTIKTLNALVFTTAILVLFASCSNSSNDEEQSSSTSFQVKGVSYDTTIGEDSGMTLEFIGDFEEFGGGSEYVLTVFGANSNLNLEAFVQFNLLVKDNTSPFADYTIVDTDEGNIPHDDINAELEATLNASGRVILDAPCFVSFFDENANGFLIAHYPSEGLIVTKNSVGNTTIRYTGSQFKRFDNNTGDFVESIDVSLHVTGTLLELLD